MTAVGTSSAAAPASHSGKGTIAAQVRRAVIWRSGTQIFSQMVAWASTFYVIHILAPADYGLFAMTTVVMTLLGLINGYGLANGLIQRREVSKHELRQLFGMLIVLNAGLAALQLAAAPWVARYYHQPIVERMLEVQALIYLTNPLLALGYAVLARAMDFHRQAQVNVIAALVGAGVALGGASAGLGVWALVVAPLALFATRAFGMIVAARAFFWPSFDFTGTRAVWGYGGMVMAGQIFGFIQGQSDIAIAGRALDPRQLGLYTVALFLSQIFVNKVVPPLNEVAFTAYARIQHERAAVAAGFLASLRAIMAVAIPFCFGLAAVAEPLVATALGPQYLDAVPIVRLLSLAMPVMTLQVLLGPATNASGRPDLTTRAAMLGAVLMPVCYLVGIRQGVIGLAAAWLVATPVFTAISLAWLLPVIGVRWREVAGAILPLVLAGIAMVLAVVALDRALPVLTPVARLGLLAVCGAATYGGWLGLFARERVAELIRMVRPKRA